MNTESVNINIKAEYMDLYFVYKKLRIRASTESFLKFSDLERTELWSYMGS